MVPRDAQAAVAFAEQGCDPLHDLVGRAEEIDGTVVLMRRLDEALEQIDTGDALR